jgi:hypothetical protein
LNSVTHLTGDHQIPADGLWWDLAPSADHFDIATHAFIFPPIPHRQWTHLRLDLPGEIDLDCGIADLSTASLRHLEPISR